MTLSIRQFFGLTVILALVAAAIPLSATGSTPVTKGRQAEGTGRVGGTAKDSRGVALPGYRVRVRNVTTGQISGESRTDDRGGFLFTGLNPGTYVVEVVSADGVVIATSSTLSLTVGAMSATGLNVTASAALGAGAAGAAGAAGGGGFFTSNTGIILLTAAAGAGIVGIIVTTKDSSPSR